MAVWAVFDDLTSDFPDSGGAEVGAVPGGFEGESSAPVGWRPGTPQGRTVFGVLAAAAVVVASVAMWELPGYLWLDREAPAPVPAFGSGPVVHSATQIRPVPVATTTTAPHAVMSVSAPVAANPSGSVPAPGLPLHCRLNYPSVDQARCL